MDSALKETKTLKSKILSQKSTSLSMVSLPRFSPCMNSSQIKFSHLLRGKFYQSPFVVIMKGKLLLQKRLLF